MQTGLLLVTLIFFGTWALLLLRSWVYVCLCALMEGCWVATIAALGLTAVEAPEAQVLFWGVGGVIFAAVELALGLFLFLVWVDLRGSLGAGADAVD